MVEKHVMVVVVVGRGVGGEGRYGYHAGAEGREHQTKGTGDLENMTSAAQALLQAHN